MDTIYITEAKNHGLLITCCPYYFYL